MNSLKLSAAVVALVVGISTVQAAEIFVSEGVVSTDAETKIVNQGSENEFTRNFPGHTGKATGITASISNIEESDLNGALRSKIKTIDDNKDDIRTNRRAIGANKSKITTNRRSIATNKSDITTNRRAIGGNKSKITTNRRNIATNKSDITTNRWAIGGNKSNITINRRNISSNTTRIGTNETNISNNTTNITTNRTNIATNASNISSNTSSIVSLEQDVDELRSGVAMAVAIANAPVLQGGKNGISVSGGFGHFKGKAASALKVAFLPTENMVLTASVATDFNDNITAGAGMGFSF
ncbi:YadA C-terminal domain-containing protein [Pseudovibrio sp. Tun.PSC04-5.I4]|uniref:YadA C-terminal domain-containing protein n=1 Tax=Pseudovibrio sp. Tun.PSC04-5.I4 TaxID=1798213 RepID=UPI0008858EBC|nr:YadA C-terminal domain-containing protein [Pseudovibrio sp. Tun.PSC04-5.I4]SDR48726.1 ECM component-binding autotransporter adhesin [Pseudovibrio sp. Tun.PSC04-5.I4]